MEYEPLSAILFKGLLLIGIALLVLLYSKRRSIKSYFTLKFQYNSFTDVVSGKMVNVYIDCYGDLWMKDNRWSLFKVKKVGSS